MSSMEFWGVEVKAGEPLKVTPDNDYIIHLSQAAISESKKEKGNESVPLWVKIDNKKILLGTLGTEKTPQLAFDLVFEKEFELSHSWKNGSVYFCGYQSVLPEEEEEFSGSDMDSDEEELLPIVKTENAKPPAGNELQAVVKAKPESAKQKPKAAEANKGSKADDDSDEDESGEDDSEDEDDDSESEEGSGEEGMSVDESDDDESESEDEETPKKAEKGKKRVNDSAIKTPIPSKKIKAATPQKTDGKKGVHTATPHPAKGAKTAAAAAAAANGSNIKTPKSGGQYSCKSCDRSFGSDVALQSHSKAKHGK